MLRNRLITVLTFFNGVLFRTKLFKPDYRYTSNFVDMWSVDEIVMVDISKAKNKNTFISVIDNFAKNCFVPLTVGGGIKKTADAKKYLDVGADKIVLNSGAIKDPKVITKIAQSYGSQCVIVGIDFKRIENQFKIYSQSGEKVESIDPVKWAIEVENLGAGEIFLNSVDRDGSLSGYDLDFLKTISQNVKIPIIIGGGAGNWKHFLEGIKNGADAVSTNNIYHFTEKSIINAKNYLNQNEVSIRI